MKENRMKKIWLCLIAFFILFNVAGAKEREYYKFEKYAPIFVNQAEIKTFIDLGVEKKMVEANNFIFESADNNLVLLPKDDIIVYKIDKSSYKSVDYFRIKIKKARSLEIIIPHGKYKIINFKNNDIVGWVLDTHLIKIN
jgi:hypothetical protein